MAQAQRERPGVWARRLPAVNIVLGIWLIASPYILRYATWETARIMVPLVGVVVFGMAITRLAMTSAQFWWLSLVNIVAGIWLIVAPFVLGYSDSQAAMLTSVITGALVVLVELIALPAFRR